MPGLFKYRKILFAFGIALIALSLILVLMREAHKNASEEVSLWRGEEQVLVFEVAETSRARQLGLSGREDLEEGMGMLFVFSREDEHGIWMKDMLFPIDIIWLDENFEVVNFKKNVSPETYPTVFTPSSPALYVIETEAGFIDRYDIKVGQVLEVRQGE